MEDSELSPYYLSLYLKPIDPEPFLVPVGVSARHIHLSAQDLAGLFGPDARLHELRPLSQPGQYAAKETLTVVGPKGVLEDVRILGPVRAATQVELALTDAYHLGLEPPVRDSGDLADTPGTVLVGPRGSVSLQKGVIAAANHMHMSPAEAAAVQLKDGDRVLALAQTERGAIFDNVLIRVSEQFRLEFHVDTDEANAALLTDGDFVEIIARKLLH